ncbi:PIG-L family deacetylase [Mesorhizobium sp. M1A.F.Ca.IN.022.05.2.1]|uniref:PIG-L deacetylase family protein n=1 Tax=Mesorhizobium sp. M1A.F.Ca.IN.022.05.2.1 TaxID=2496760 RepID=UPI000FCC4E6E|nr:PIG-L family deacetylase [Mesorhizobium sp. M1A.F.Ca.IN.022.05.2.1]RUW07677.1 PIG-L family deacetylase [Mesorhizobium sp. M1A.F.Ca.IN.022.05.2.1]
MKILALGAHPDDIEIFMFGTLAAYAALGAELTFAIATDGAKGGKGDPKALVKARREEATAASFEVPVLHADTLGGTGFSPSHYVDISSHWDLKAQAILAHRSQGPEHYLNGARMQNAFRAGQCNGAPGALAEAFRFEPLFPFADIRELLPPAPRIRPVTVGPKTVR